jgi:recombination protein RecA
MTRTRKPTTKNDNSADDRIGAIAKEINQQFGEGALMSLGAGPQADVDSTSTGSLTLDRALGTGGYPRGRIVEVFGPESSGKTTLSLHAIAEVQARGGTAAFIDAEHAFDMRYAQALGVDLKRLLVAQPDCGEQGLDITGKLVESGAVDLVVVDSVAALVPKAEIDGEMGDHHVGLHARLMSRGVRKLTADASRTKTCVLFINQLRTKIGVMFGNPETTTGGNALRFFASVRLDVRRIGKVTSGDTSIGNRTRVKVVKNKMAPPFQEAEFDIRWGEGIDRFGELLDAALDCGLVTRSGAHFSIDGKTVGQGREKARAALVENPSVAKAILARLTGSTSESTAAKEAPQKGPAAQAA